MYFLFAFVFLIIGFSAFALFYDPVHDTLTSLGSTSANQALNKVTPNSVFSWMDFMLVCFYFAINVVICIVLPYYVEHNPIYYVILLLFSFGYTYGVAVTSNIIVEFLQGVGSSFSMTLSVLNNLVMLEIVFLLIMGFVMYFKGTGGSHQPYY